MISKLREVKENNDSLFLLKFLKMMGMNQRALTRVLSCSNVVNHWAMGYRKIPVSFKRFMLVLRFIHELDLMPELMKYIKHHESQGWGSSDIKQTNWLKLNDVDTGRNKRKRKC